MQIIGITGTNSAGKGTVVEIYNEYGFKHFSVREYLSEELERRGIEVDRNQLRELANSIRSTHGPGYIVKELYKRAREIDKPSVIESIRCIGEVEKLREFPNFQLIGVDADPLIRYKRSQLRGSKTDRVSFDEFIRQEQLEMDSEDKGKQNLKGCIELADIVFINNGTIEDLKEKIEIYIKTHNLN
jgi:dephospho-CoA kinase